MNFTSRTRPIPHRWRVWAVAAWSLAAGWVQGSVTIEVQIGDLPIDAGTVGTLVADAAGDGFFSLESTTVLGTNLIPGQRLGPSDDVIVDVLQASNRGLWQGGVGFAEVLKSIDYDALGLTPGVPLIFYWLPQQTTLPANLLKGQSYRSLRSNAVGVSGGTIAFSTPANRGVYALVHLTPALGGDLDLENPGANLEVGHGIIGDGASKPTLDSLSDSGDFDSDGITNDNTPTFSGTGPVGTVVTLTSDRDGNVGSATVDSNGDWIITTLGLTDGIHQITASDGGLDSMSVEITIDTSAPDAPTMLDLDDASDLGPSSSDDVTRNNTPRISGKTAESGLAISLTSNLEGIIGTSTTNGSWSIDTSVLRDGAHDLSATARDLAGNTSSSSAELSVTIDTLAPSTTLNQAGGQADPASTGPVSFSAVFSEDVFGFANNDVAAGGSAAGAVSVSGGPSAYTVSVAATANEGTITAAIAAGAATDLAGNLTDASVSSDNSVTLDSHGGDSGSATPVVFNGGGTMTDGWIAPGDTDVFSFSLSMAQTVDIRTTGNVDTRGVLRSSDGGLLNDPEADRDSGTGSNFRTTTFLGTGTYTVTVTSEGTATTGAYSLHINLGDIPLVINEVDATSQGGDSREFIELFDGGVGDFPLTGYVLVLFDGDADEVYAAFDLDGQSTDANGYFVIGNAAVSETHQTFPEGTLHGGADSVAMFVGNDTDFVNGTAVTVSGLADAVVYDSGQPDDTELLALLNAGEPQVNENEHGNPVGHSLQRIPNGSGGARNTTAFMSTSPTPGGANSAPGVPTGLDLTDDSDTGLSNSDELTMDNTPTLTGSARPGSLITLRSDLDGELGTDVADGTGGWTITSGIALREGTHSLTAMADDSLPSSALEIEIDVTPPAAPLAPDLSDASDSGISAEDNITNHTSLTVTGIAEAGVSITLISNLDGIAGNGSAGPNWTIPTKILREGTHILTATATDAAGNESVASVGLGIQIDTMAPSVIVDQASGQPDPASDAPVEFSIVFSEPVTDFEVADATFGGSALPGSPALSGSGDSYTATAGSVGGEGTVTVSVGAGVAVDLAGNPNVASTSGDNLVIIDSHGATAGLATTVPLNGGAGAASGWLEDGDIDVFSFTIIEPKHVEIKTTGDVDTEGTLNSAGGLLLNDPIADGNGGIGENFLIDLPLSPGTYSIAVSKGATGNSGAFQLEISLGAMVNFQPDNLVGKNAGRTIGDDIYGTAAGQTLKLTSKRARKVRGVAMTENDGELPDVFSIRGTRGNRLFKVIYITRAGNVTAAIITGTYETGTIAPTDSAHVISVKVKPNKKKIIKRVKRGGRRRVIVKKKRITLNLSSLSQSDGTSSDTIFVRIQTK